MAKTREIRCYDYVNRPYESVRDALGGDAVALFQKATTAAADRAQAVAAQLTVNIAGIEVGTDIRISITKMEETPGDVTTPRTLRLWLEWEAAKKPRLFPLMRAELSVYPLTGSESQLDLRGSYEPPLGAIGSVVNSLVGHRIADASVHRFVQDVGAHLREVLPEA